MSTNNIGFRQELVDLENHHSLLSRALILYFHEVPFFSSGMLDKGVVVSFCSALGSTGFCLVSSPPSMEGQTSDVVSLVLLNLSFKAFSARFLKEKRKRLSFVCTTYVGKLVAYTICE